MTTTVSLSFAALTIDSADPVALTIFNSGGYQVWSGGALRGMPEV